MQRVFISNNSDVASSDFIIDENFDVAALTVTDEHKKGNTIFIIDVHCTFKGTEKLQQQGGVIIYRHLLKHFDGKQDKLKVVFYSPLNQAELVAIKPENYILNLLPFIECKYEEGQFEKELYNIISANNFPQFNNASENLLDGWALAGAEKINTNNKKILFLDDQQLEWEMAFKEIFNKIKLTDKKPEEQAVSFINEKVERNQIKSSNEKIRDKLINSKNDFYNKINERIEKNKNNIGIILSDLYFIENHETEVFKESKDIEIISGYGIYNAIRGKFPHIPYIFHTSSNKANVYKFFDTRGVDEWIVKDIRLNATNKKDHFEYFKKQIEFYTQNPLIDFLKSFWDKIQALEKDETYKKKWWFTYPDLLNGDVNKAKDILQTLKDTWFVFRQQINKETHFEKSIKTSEWDSQSFITAAIINTLNQIKEILNIKEKKFYGQLTHTITKIRNAAAHSKNDSVYTFKLLDAQIFTNLILDLFCLKDNDIKVNYPLNSNNKIRYLKISKRDFNPNCNDSNSFKHELFWIYAQMYCLSIDNNKVSYDSENILKRLKEMYPNIKDCEDFKNKLQNYYINNLLYFDTNWHKLKTKLE